MGDARVFQGDAGAYTVDAPAPFAFGRTSMCLRGRDQAGKEVCIKVFNRAPKTPRGEPAVEDFARELRARQRMSHPHILPLIDFGLSEPSSGAPFIVMPLCRGDLRLLLENRSYVPLHEVLPVLQQAATGIDFAHGLGVIHGDIKPENILFADSGNHVYLSDFGVAHFFSFDEPIMTLEPVMEAGSTAYLSPEQVSDGKQSPQSDVYSFAVVAYELLTGTFPVDRSLPPFRQMLAKVQGETIDPRVANPILSDSVRAALLAGLAVDRAQRPASATEFCNRLAAQAPVAVPATASPPPAANAGGFARWWSSLETGGRVAVITVLITAVFGLLGTMVGIVPNLISALKDSPPTAAGKR